MRMPDEPYDLDAEIAKYGGRVSLQVALIGQHTDAVGRPAADPATSSPAPYDLDAEIAKYGGQRPVRLASPAATEDPLAGLDHLDPSLRPEIEAFTKALGAAIDMVIPQTAPDPRIAGGMSWHQRERYRLDRIFREGGVTREQACQREQLQKVERKAWHEQQRRVQRGWAKWERWWHRAPTEAEGYRLEHEDGRIDWLLELAARRAPLGRSAARKKHTKGADI